VTAIRAIHILVYRVYTNVALPLFKSSHQSAYGIVVCHDF